MKKQIKGKINIKNTNSQKIKNKKFYKIKYKELKEKLKSTKILNKEKLKIKKRKAIVSKNNAPLSTLKQIKLANKKHRGNANIKNTPGNIIDVQNLEKIYVTGNTTYTALKNVTFSIKAGDVVVILGPSGSGKSTLLNVISGLDRSTKGNIIVNNINLVALKNNELTTFRRENVGFIFQSYNLLPSLSAKDNALLGSILQRDPNKRIPIKEIFEKMNLGNMIDSNIKNLSGGQQQRVSIARAIAKNPKILFADEPTGALDSVTSSKIVDLLLYINKKYKTTIVFVTHDESLIRIASKVIVVNDGKVSTK